MTARDEAGQLPQRAARPPYVVVAVTPGPAHLARWVQDRIRVSAASMPSAPGFRGLEIWQFAQDTRDGQAITACLSRWDNPVQYRAWHETEPARAAAGQTRAAPEHAELADPYRFRPPDDWQGMAAGGYRLISVLGTDGVWWHEPDEKD